MKKKFEYMRKSYWGCAGVWSDEYFVLTIGIDEHVIKKYIEHQGLEGHRQVKLKLWYKVKN